MQNRIRNVKKAKLTPIGNRPSKSHGITQNKTKFANKPWRLALLYAINKVYMADNATKRNNGRINCWANSHDLLAPLQGVGDLCFAVGFCRMKENFSAHVCAPISIFNVFAVVEN